MWKKVKPISDQFIPEALAVSGYTREETLLFDEPAMVMEQFSKWIKEVVKDRPVFISTTMVLTGCLFAGIFIISPVPIHLDIVLKTWEVYTKGW